VPTRVIAALSAGAAETVWNAPDVMIAGAMVIVRLPEPSAVPSARATNCCRYGRVALVTGLTANTEAIVNTSPSLMTAPEAVQPSVMSDWVPGTDSVALAVA
jgi:hypothetical protein